MFREFRNFIIRGNIIDMLVGIIIGSAFTSIVNSLVSDIILPIIGVLLTDVDFSDLFIVLKKGITDNSNYTTVEMAKNDGAIVVSIGLFLNSIISFFITSVSVFILLKTVSKLKDRFIKDKKEEEQKDIKVCPYCFTNIKINAIKCPNCTSSLN